ncbi:MAG: hypothetical protein KC656_01725 [Myxococcales bacterium]|nr:hypothetical protein [Myxococcales bacterium]
MYLMMARTGSKFGARGLAAALVLAASGLAWIVTVARTGVGASPDTATYLAGARALVDGTLHVPLAFRPFTEVRPALTGWPPGYPLLLAVGLALGVPGPVWLTVVAGV